MRVARSIAWVTLRRVMQLLSVVLVVLLLTALLLRVVPGDPARAILGVRASPSALAAMRHQLGLDRTMPSQLWRVVARVGRGDLGDSVVENTPVTTIISTRIGVTLELVLLGSIFATAMGLGFGLLTGLTGRRAVRILTRAPVLVGLALPTFGLGLILLLVVGVRLKWAPAGGWAGGVGALQYLWLPALALSAYLAALIARSTNRAVLTVCESQFYEAAVARGLSRRRLVLRHVLPNSLPSVVVILGVNAAYLISGAVTIEAVFGLPGLGSELALAAQNRDFPVVQGIAVASAVIAVLIGWLTEIIVAAIDPRVRHAR